jgi:hypothetical protein
MRSTNLITVYAYLVFLNRLKLLFS